MALTQSLDFSLDGDSVLHQADPRLKLVGLVGFVAAASLVPRGAAPAYAAMLLLALAAIAASRLPLLSVLKRSAPALFFATTVAVSALLQARGSEYFAFRLAWVRVAVGPYGVDRFLDVLARSWLCATVIGLYVAITPFPQTAGAMRALGVPSTFVSVVALTYRYLAVLLDEARRMERARDARTLRPAGLAQVGAQARLAGTMLGSLFLRAYGRSERVYQAMLARGYDGEARPLSRLAWRRSDSLLLAVWATGLATSVLLPLLGRAL